MSPNVKMFLIGCGAVAFMRGLEINGLDWASVIPDVLGSESAPSAPAVQA